MPCNCERRDDEMHYPDCTINRHAGLIHVEGYSGTFRRTHATIGQVREALRLCLQEIEANGDIDSAAYVNAKTLLNML